ncbi:MAG: hypothetical protein HQ494_08370 [Rhodospirillales bacterium]|nr:hypothetical protein [Rhodospirillales bacterium]
MLGWRNKPGIACSFLLPAGGAPYSTGLLWSAFDANGFMVSEPGGPKHPRKKPDGVFRIIMLGDSSLAGFGAPPMQSIAGHTQRILNDQKKKTGVGPTYQVINAGVGGYNSAQQYLYLASELIYYQPDIVFFFNGWTESINRHGHFSDSRFAYMRKSKKFKPVEFSSIQTKKHRDYSAFIDRSYTLKGAAVILKNALSRALGNSWDQTGMGYWAWKLEFRKNWKGFWKAVLSPLKKSEKRPDVAVAIKADLDPRVLRVYEENIHRSIMQSKLEGFKALFVLQPVIGVDGKAYSPEERLWVDTKIGKAKIIRRSSFYEKARPLLSSIARENADDKSLCFADMSGVLQDVKKRVYVDEGHLNSYGNRLVAEKIIDQFRECSFLPSLPE